MRPTPDNALLPQASASTNSATRASSVVDGVSHSDTASSSQVEFPTPEISKHLSIAGVGNQNQRRQTERRAIQFGDPRLPDRLWRRIQPCPMSGCWIWTGCATPKGYGYASRPGPPRKPFYVHRWTYEIANGGLPPADMELDHLCRQPSCCNPLHLEAVTCRENALRGIGWAAINAAKTHCRHGHEYTVENTLRNPDGTRRCKICRDACRRRYGELAVASGKYRKPGSKPKPRKNKRAHLAPNLTHHADVARLDFALVGEEMKMLKEGE